MKKEAILTPKVASPTGAYSQAIRAGNLLFIAGQVARDSQGKLVGRGDVVVQAEQVMESIKALLEAAGATFDNVVKMNVFVTTMEHREQVSEIRRRYLKEPFPTSTLVQVSRLADPDYLVEIEAIAAL